MKNRKLLLIVSLVLALTMSLGGTLAYLTDTDEAVNVMTLGNVKIEQLELQRAEGVAYNAGKAGVGNGVKDGALVPFEQGQALYPAYPVADATNPYTAEPDDLFYWGDYVYSGTAANGLWNDNKLKGALDKFVFVKNTGDSDCYFRTWIAFECPEGMEYSEGPDKEFMNNVSGSSLYEWEDKGYITIGGVRYAVLCATYQQALAAGNTSHPSLLQVVMTHNATNEDMEKLGGTYEILAFSQAVQTKNMPDAETALNAAFGTDHPWGDEVNGLPTTTVTTAAELKAALENGGIIVVANDIVVEDTLKVPAGVKAELILNGNISQQKAQTAAAYAMIENKGELTISGTGTISYEDIGNGGEYASNTIANHGVLNIKGGTIENNSSDAVKNAGYPHAIDAYQGSVTNITGGTVKSVNYDCIRMFCNSTTLNTEVNISGGNIINRVSFQNPSSNKAGYGRLNITGGTFTTTDDVNANVRLLNFSTDASNMKATISGGTFDKGVKTQNYSNETVALADWLTVTNVTVNEVN